VGLTVDGRVLYWGFDIGAIPPGLQCVRSITAGGFHVFAEVGADGDSDGLCDQEDNCPEVPNPTQADCNADGVGDACAIAVGAPDFNGNGIPDSCECISDLFVDGQINGADLGALLSQWGPASPTTVSDLNHDGQVNGADLGYLLSQWGPCGN
ncbi:MAG: thrombospondin type 3 repeat-containing protein, partial [Actinomycetales bacterium]